MEDPQNSALKAGYCFSMPILLCRESPAYWQEYPAVVFVFCLQLLVLYLETYAVKPARIFCGMPICVLLHMHYPLLEFIDI